MDPYVYPGTDVLRNLRDIRDAERLGKFEAIATTRRIIELEHTALEGGFDSQHLQAIHRHIFQDLYDWAGKLRTVNISKSGDPFAFPQHIGSSLEKICEELKSEGHLADCDAECFARRGAYHLGEINAIHPFPEGKGRTQREFIRKPGVRNGLATDWTRVSREEMIEASIRSLRIDNAGLERILKIALRRGLKPCQRE